MQKNKSAYSSILARSDKAMPNKHKDRNKSGRKRPEFAPGNYDLLEEKASGKEIKEDRATKVTRLAFDEVDPS